MKIRATTAVCKAVLAAAVMFSLAACGQKSAESLVASAKASLAQDDFKAAQIHLKNALAEEPRNAEARFLLGKVLLDSGELASASVEFGKAEEAGFDPNRLVPLQAKALLMSRESRNVLQRFEATELNDPDAKAELLAVIAQAHKALGHDDKARQAVDRALATKPGHVAASLVLARMQASDKKMDEALATVDAALKASPKDAEALRLKGGLLMLGKNDAAAALAAYEKAVEYAPRDLNAHQTLIGHLLSQRQIDPATQRLQAMSKQFGKVPAVLFFSAVIELEKGQVELAADYMQALLKAAPEDARVLTLAGQIELFRGRDLQAEAHLSKALSQPGDTSRARLLLAQAQLRMADPAKALQTIQPLLEGSDRNGRAHAVAGDAYAQMGESRKAQEQFKIAAELDPKDARSRTMVAMAQVMGGQETRGLDQLRDLAENMDSPYADLALVGTLARKADFDGALKAIDGFEKKAPNKPEASNMRAQVYQAKGDIAAAQAAWEESLRRDPKNLPAAVQLGRLDFAAKRNDAAVARFAAVAKADDKNPVAQLAWLQARQLAGEALPSLVTAAQDLVKRYPKVVRVRLALVRLLEASGDREKALSAAQDAVAAMDAEPELIEQLGRLQVRKGDLNQALQTMNLLVALRPKSADALLRVAEVEVAAKNLRGALASVRKALALSAEHPSALRLQVALETELGNVEAARKLVKDVQGMRGLEVLGLILEGDLESSQQAWPEAAAAYKRAATKGSNAPLLAAKYHRALLSAGKPDEAKALEQQLLKDRPNDWQFLSYLGDVALTQSDWPTAQAHYEKVLKALPNDVGVQNNLAWVLLRSGNSKAAIELARKAAAAQPTNAAVLDTLSTALSESGDHAEAIELQRRAVAMDADNPARRVALARRYLAAKQNEKAKDELTGVAKLGAKYAGQAEVQSLMKSL